MFGAARSRTGLSNLDRIAMVFFIAYGLVVMVFHRRFALSAYRWQNRLWGLRFSERDITIGSMLFLLGGFVFVVFRVLALLGVIGFRH